MAVEFREKSFAIVIETNSNPIEDWLELHNEILHVLQTVDTSNYIEKPWRTLWLLESMMPDYATAKEMMK